MAVCLRVREHGTSSLACSRLCRRRALILSYPFSPPFPNPSPYSLSVRDPYQSPLYRSHLELGLRNLTTVRLTPTMLSCLLLTNPPFDSAHFRLVTISYTQLRPSRHRAPPQTHRQALHPRPASRRRTRFPPVQALDRTAPTSPGGPPFIVQPAGRAQRVLVLQRQILFIRRGCRRERIGTCGAFGGRWG